MVYTLDNSKYENEVFDYIVDEILPTEEVHLMGGPSGGGKSTLLFQLLQAWSRGEDVFGYHSRPGPYIYVSLDRSGRGIRRTLKRMNVPITAIPYFPAFDYPEIQTIDQVLQAILEAKPEAKLVVIEGIAGKVPGNKVNDYGIVSEYLGRLAAWCKQFHKTILGVVHSSKSKANEIYENPRQRILGSVAWAAFSETIIGFEPVEAKDVECKLRRLYLLPRNAPEQTFNMEWSGGILIPASSETTASQYRKGPRGRKNDRLRETLDDIQLWFKHDSITEVKFEEILDQMDAPRATVRRAVDALIDAGTLRMIKRGRYSVVTPFNDPLTLGLSLPKSTQNIPFEDAEDPEDALSDASNDASDDASSDEEND